MPVKILYILVEYPDSNTILLKVFTQIMENQDLEDIEKHYCCQNTGGIIDRIRPARGIVEIQRINMEVNLPSGGEI